MADGRFPFCFHRTIMKKQVARVLFQAQRRAAYSTENCSTDTPTVLIWERTKPKEVAAFLMSCLFQGRKKFSSMVYYVYSCIFLCEHSHAYRIDVAVKQEGRLSLFNHPPLIGKNGLVQVWNDVLNWRFLNCGKKHCNVSNILLTSKTYTIFFK